MKRAPASSIETSAAPRVRRGYFECRFGQLHVHNAMPPGGGFDEGTALLCLHQTPMSGRVFRHFLEVMGRDRSTYAPDLPGYGESDAPPARPTVGDYAGAMGDFLGAMRFRQIDVLGYHTGAAIAVELAIARPQQVRRLVLVGVPMFNEVEREAFKRSPWPAPVAEDGSHLTAEWRRSLEWRGAGVSLETMAQRFAEKLNSGSNGWWGANAVMQHPMRERLGLVTQPLIVLRPKDDLWEATLRTREVLPRARIVDLADHGAALFDAAPGVVADATREFLKG